MSAYLDNLTILKLGGFTVESPHDNVVRIQLLQHILSHDARGRGEENDMNLDTPAKSVPLQDETYKFINSVIGTSAAVEFEGHFTLILTHIPMYKPAGICVDAPFFDFHSQGDGGGLKEQYLLSGDASKGLLEGIFGVSADTNAAANGLGAQRHGYEWA